ncbi:hypothetical protein Ae505Ps2_5348c [Pseudonocardia sp. Ae505_Ps2]|nr:hypothetical protein Ae331Ps2_3842 [Pseudonocardia sp. Ae331_Ps2]OLM15216.1 hypothetical protein Ae505Ps2_5348c [Pseudonocardia sp. Ae505_Ps2]
MDPVPDEPSALATSAMSVLLDVFGADTMEPGRVVGQPRGHRA